MAGFLIISLIAQAGYTSAAIAAIGTNRHFGSDVVALSFLPDAFHNIQVCYSSPLIMISRSYYPGPCVVCFSRIPEFCGLLFDALHPTCSSPSSFQPHRYKKNNVKGLFSLLHLFLTYHWSYLSAGYLGHTILMRFEMTAKVNKVIWPLCNSTSSANLTSYGEQSRYMRRTPHIYYPQNNDPDKFLS